MADALFGERSDADIADKSSVLTGLRDDVFWLIDAVEHPINLRSNADARLQKKIFRALVSLQDHNSDSTTRQRSPSSQERGERARKSPPSGCYAVFARYAL